MSFDQAFAFTVSPAVEGGYTDDPNDPGGATKYGISHAAFPGVNIRALTLTTACALYESNYWMRASCDRLPPAIAGLVFDAAVNQGVGTAVRLLQSAADAVPDGVAGPKTLAAVASANLSDLHCEIARLRDAHYRSLDEWPIYGTGWTRRLMRAVAATWAFT